MPHPHHPPCRPAPRAYGPLHLVVTQGYKFAQDYDDDSNNDRSRLYFKEQKQEIIFIVIAAGLTFFISLALLAGICTDCISPRVKHVLATFNLLLELSIAVVVALRASNNYNWRDAESGLEGTLQLSKTSTAASNITTDCPFLTLSSPSRSRWSTSSLSSLER